MSARPGTARWSRCAGIDRPPTAQTGAVERRDTGHAPFDWSSNMRMSSEFRYDAGASVCGVAR